MFPVLRHVKRPHVCFPAAPESNHVLVFLLFRFISLTLIVRWPQKFNTLFHDYTARFTAVLRRQSLYFVSTVTAGR
jgi:hypothetical protein